MTLAWLEKALEVPNDQKKNGKRLRHTAKSVTLMETSNFTGGKKSVFLTPELQPQLQLLIID